MYVESPSAIVNSYENSLSYISNFYSWLLIKVNWDFVLNTFSIPA